MQEWEGEFTQSTAEEGNEVIVKSSAIQLHCGHFFH